MRKLCSLLLTAVLLLALPPAAFAMETTPEPTAPVEPPAATEEPMIPTAEPEAPEKTPTVIDQLRIDGTTLYEGMDRSYEQGYIPHLEEGSAVIVLPLLGETYDGKVTVTADLGATADSPFVFGNYSQTETMENGVYLFRLQIPLAGGRINGTYCISLTASYLNVLGEQTKQDFPVYVTVYDGVDPVTETPYAGGGKETVETPKLFLRSCALSPETVGGEEEFTVSVEIENIGELRARSVLLSYGSDTPGIIPAQTNNAMHLEDIDSGQSINVSFALKTCKDVLAGEQPFFVKLDYTDLFGSAYTENRSFLVGVTQPAEMEYDPLTVPKQLTAGETISVPVNVFNTGKSVLQNVTAVVSGSGLIPTSSVFLGNIQPGQAGNGTMEIYIGTLSMTGGEKDYGKTEGTFSITYTDESGEKYTEKTTFSTEIMQPPAEKENLEEQKTAGQWWISVLVAFAVIAILVSCIVVTKFTRLLRMR